MHKIAENWRGDLNITSLVPTGPTDRRIVSIISEVKEKVWSAATKESNMFNINRTLNVWSHFSYLT